MNLRGLYTRINSALAHVLVLKGQEVISTGSGFCFLPTGQILTAAHTIAGGFPVQESDLRDTNRTILVRLLGQQKALLYKPAIWPIEIHASFEGMKPLQLDIAIITPIEVKSSNFEYLTASTHSPEIGDELYFAGFSDEIEFPFGVDRLIDSTMKGMDSFRREFEYDVRRLASGPMIKRGIVGNAVDMTASNSLISAKIRAFYLDNQIHSGASGGPIVTREGVANGIIVKRAMTSTNDNSGGSVLVPSGSTMGISLEILKMLQPEVLIHSQAG